MDQDKLIAVLLTKEEIFQLMIMCHDSSIYWGGHLLKASHDPNYYLSESGCKLVIENNKAVIDKVEAIYDALKSEEKEEQDSDESLKED